METNTSKTLNFNIMEPTGFTFTKLHKGNIITNNNNCCYIALMKPGPSETV